MGYLRYLSRWRVGIAVASGLVSSGCSSTSSDEQAPVLVPPTVPCIIDSDCDQGWRCATSGAVHEVQLEPGEQGSCVPAAEVIGEALATWPWVTGGATLAQRLCTAQGLSGGTGAAADERRQIQRALLEAAGVAVVRLDLRWDKIEPAEGELDFSAYDPMIDAALASGIEVIGILAYGVPWASTLTDDDKMFPPDDPADYAAYAQAVASHYAGKVQRYELWNEPNAGWRFFRPELHGDAAHFADLVISATTAIDEVCADCLVFSGGVFFNEQVVNGGVEFAHDMLSARPQALAGVDAFGFHPYPKYPPSAPPEAEGAGERALGAMVADLRAVLALHGVDGALPLAGTELGWPSYEGVSELDQAAYLSRAMLLGTSLGIDPLCWFNVVDGPEHGTFPPEDDFGLYHYGSDQPDGTVDPKPARDALAWLAQVGQQAAPVGPSDDPALHDPEAGRFALEFDLPTGRLTALWRTSGQEVVQLGNESRTAYDMLGQVVATPTGGALSLSVSGQPLFLVP